MSSDLCSQASRVAFEEAGVVDFEWRLNSFPDIPFLISHVDCPDGSEDLEFTIQFLNHRHPSTYLSSSEYDVFLKDMDTFLKSLDKKMTEFLQEVVSEVAVSNFF